MRPVPYGLFFITVFNSHIGSSHARKEKQAAPERRENIPHTRRHAQVQDARQSERQHPERQRGIPARERQAVLRQRIFLQRNKLVRGVQQRKDGTRRHAVAHKRIPEIRRRRTNCPGAQKRAPQAQGITPHNRQPELRPPIRFGVLLRRRPAVRQRQRAYFRLGRVFPANKGSYLQLQCKADKPKIRADIRHAAL